MSCSDPRLGLRLNWQDTSTCSRYFTTFMVFPHSFSSWVFPSFQWILLGFSDIFIYRNVVCSLRKQLYGALSGVYTLSGGLQLPKAEAQAMTHLLALKRAEPDDLKELYKAVVETWRRGDVVYCRVMNCVMCGMYTYIIYSYIYIYTYDIE